MFSCYYINRSANVLFVGQWKLSVVWISVYLHSADNEHQIKNVLKYIFYHHKWKEVVELNTCTQTTQNKFVTFVTFLKHMYQGWGGPVEYQYQAMLTDIFGYEPKNY